MPIRIIFFTILFIVNIPCYSNILNLNEPEVGLKYKYSNIKGKEAYKQFFPVNYNGFELNINNKFDRYWGAGIGLAKVSTEVQKKRIGSGAKIFKITTNSIRDTMVKVKMNSIYFDFNFFLPLDYYLTCIASIGTGLTQVEIDTNSSLKKQLDNAIQSIAGKKNLIARLGFGLNYMLTDMLGVTGMLRWESTSKLRIKGNTAFTELDFDKKVFSDTIMLNFGFFIKF